MDNGHPVGLADREREPRKTSRDLKQHHESTELSARRLPDFFAALRAPRAFLGVLFTDAFAEAAMAKCSSFLPDLSAAVSQRGFSPRPAHVSLGFSGLRYFGGTGPRAPMRSRH